MLGEALRRRIWPNSAVSGPPSALAFARMLWLVTECPTHDEGYAVQHLLVGEPSLRLKNGSVVTLCDITRQTFALVVCCGVAEPVIERRATPQRDLAGGVRLDLLQLLRRPVVPERLVDLPPEVGVFATRGQEGGGHAVASCVQHVLTVPAIDRPRPRMHQMLMKGIKLGARGRGEEAWDDPAQGSPPRASSGPGCR